MLVILSAFFLLLQGVFSSPLSRAIVASPKSSSQDYLLPNDIQPNHYILELEPDFENDVFNGSVSIEFTVKTTTKNISFHRKELTFEKENIYILSAGNEVPVFPIIEPDCDDTDREICVLTFENELVANNDYTLRFDSFSGILNLDNAGFYLAKYTDENDNEM